MLYIPKVEFWAFKFEKLCTLREKIFWELRHSRQFQLWWGTQYKIGLWGYNTKFVKIYPNFTLQNYLIRLRLCTRHNSGTFMTCTELWTDWTNGIKNSAKRIYASCWLLVHKPFWWHSARLQYVQCISNGDIAVLQWAINLWNVPSLFCKDSTNFVFKFSEDVVFHNFMYHKAITYWTCTGSTIVTRFRNSCWDQDRNNEIMNKLPSIDFERRVHCKTSLCTICFVARNVWCHPMWICLVQQHASFSSGTKTLLFLARPLMYGIVLYYSLIFNLPKIHF